jgi:hypothetical protein
MVESVNIIKYILAWFYGLQAFMVVPWFLGAIYRKEQSLWVWEEIYYGIGRHGIGSKILTVYLYIIFYLFPFISTFFIMRLVFKELNRYLSNDIIYIIYISTWAMATFLFFLPSCCEFIRNIPNLWHGWVFILWCTSTGLVIFIFWKIIRKK